MYITRGDYCVIDVWPCQNPIQLLDRLWSSNVLIRGQPPRWEHFNQAGEDAVEQGTLREAALHFQTAVREAQRKSRPTDRLAVSLTNLADVYLQLERWVQAD